MPSSTFFATAAEKLAYEKRRGILSSLFSEALGKRKDVALGQIKFHALKAVHGEKDHAGGEGVAVLDLRSKVIEGCDVDAAQTEAFSGEMEDRAPEFFARIR